MAVSAYLVSTLVMGLLAVGVLVLVVRGRPWHHYVPQAAYAMESGGGRPRSPLSRAAGSTATWTTAFTVLVVATIGSIVLVLSDAVSATVVIVGLAVLVLAYLVGGVYYAMRSAGRPSSQAAAGSAVTVGFLLVLGISAMLVLGL